MTQSRTTERPPESPTSQLRFFTRVWHGFLRIDRVTRYAVTVGAVMLLAGVAGYPHDSNEMLVVYAFGLVAGIASLAAPEPVVRGNDDEKEWRTFLGDLHTGAPDASLRARHTSRPHLN